MSFVRLPLDIEFMHIHKLSWNNKLPKIVPFIVVRVVYNCFNCSALSSNPLLTDLFYFPRFVSEDE